ncbi:MAG TPA: GNAT family N-acetyltransferase, partial [Ktedonobacterales bacterium]|nr:GNAT family N-acetyltransferase [Ktedonobacterales bacterium]
ATQDMRKRMAACYALVEFGATTIIGYYTLSTAAVQLMDLPTEASKKLPRYPYVPAALLGRLAVDARFQGQGYGDILLGDAFVRILRLSAEIAINLVIVDALHEQAAAYYERHEFKRLADAALRLFLPVAKLHDIFPDMA